MKSHWAFALLLSGLMVAGAASRSAAEEPAREFLQALREKGYFDVAVEYLDNVQNNPLVPPSFREVVQYEKGLILVDASRLQRDMALREKQLDEAQAMFKAFVEARQTNPLVTAANSQLGNLVVERARMKVEQAKTTTDAAKKKTLLDDAEKMYKDSREVFKQLQEQIKTTLDAIPKVIPPGPGAAPLIARRDQLRADYLQARLLHAAVTEENADVKVEGSPEYKALVQEAADLYKQIYEDYRTRLAGLYARLYQGRCHWKLKDYKNALSFFTDLLEQPNQPEFRLLKKKTLILAVEILLNDQQPKYMEVIKRVEPLVETLNQVEQVDPEWLKLQVALVKAYKFRIEALAAEKPRPPEYPESINKGRALVRFLMRTPSDFQEEARLLALAFDVNVIDPSAGGPQDFAEALEAGREQLALMQTGPQTVERLTADLKAATDQQKKDELQKQLEEAQKLAQGAPDEAMRFFRMALEMATVDTPIADINLAQYFLTYLHYVRAEYWDAAVLGEFVARRYPDSGGARQCAKIAMACYLKLYSQTDDSTFETAQTIGICEHILDRWPDQPEAVDAANTLIALVLKDGRVEDAARYVSENIPPDAPYRGLAELKTGQAIWASYLKGMQAAREIAETERQAANALPEAEQKAALEAAEAKLQEAIAKLEPNKTQAEATLAAGVARMRQAGGVDETFATSLLSLAQIYVDVGKVDEAIRECEDPQVGVLTLVRAKHPATTREGYAVEAYKTALRAYVSSLANSADPDKTIEKAKGVMAELKAAMGGGAEGEQKLVQTYLGMAQQLEAQIQNSDAVAKQALSKGFETFLKQLAAEAKELNVLSMVADSFFSLGSGLDTGAVGRGIPAEAKRYYEEAAKAFKTILDKGANDPAWLPAKEKSQAQFRLAKVRRKMGEYKEAIAAYRDILADNNMTLNIQVEAADAYREWADTLDGGRLLLYERAMIGSSPDDRAKINGVENKNFNQNIIWGWGKIGKITQRYPDFRETFHQSRYNLALCRMRYALQKESRDDVKKYLEMAKSDIEMTQRLYPELGGPQWTDKYDRLVKEIQGELGQPREGLKAFAKAAEPASK